MSHLVTAPFDMNMRQGISWSGAIEVAPQQLKPRKVIFQLRYEDTATSFTVGLDQSDALRVWLVDEQRQIFTSDAIDIAPSQNRVTFVEATIKPIEDSRQPEVATSVDQVEPHRYLMILDNHEGKRLEQEILAFLPSGGLARSNIGANCDGAEAAAVKIGLIALSGPLSDEDAANIEAHINREWNQKPVAQPIFKHMTRKRKRS